MKTIKTIAISVVFSIILVFSAKGVTPIIINLQLNNSDTQDTIVEVSENQRKVKTYHSSNPLNSLEIKHRGDIDVTDNDKDIKSISPHGFLEFSQTTFGNKRKIHIESNSRGELSYEYYEGRKQIEFEPNGRKWMEDVLIEVIRKSGIDADGRTERIYNEAGIDGLIDEISTIDGSYVKSQYIDAAFSDKNIENNDLLKLTEDLDNIVNSDFENARILKDNADRFLSDQNLSETYFEAISKVNSDFEQAGVFRHILKKHELNDDQLSMLLNSTKKISSDFEQASVLRIVADKYELEGEVFRTFMDVAKDVSSDFESANVLKITINRQNLDDEKAEELFEVIEDIDSDFEMAGVLRSFTEHQREFSEAVSEAFFECTENISSDFEHAGLLKDVMIRVDLDEDLISDLIDNTIHVASDFEKSGLYEKVTEKNDLSENNINELIEASKSIKSDFEMARLYKSLVRNQDLSNENYIQLFEAMDNIHSDFEKANAMIEVCRKMPKDDDLIEAYRNLAKTIRSDTEYGRVIRCID